MFLNNWYKLLNAYNKTINKSSAYTYVTDMAGNSVSADAVAEMNSTSWSGLQLFCPNLTRYVPTLYAIQNDSNVYYGNNSSSYPHGGVIIGDGDTPPTPSDYALSGNKITTFTATTTVTSNVGDGYVEGVGTYNITNTGSSPFTVREIALGKVRSSTTPYQFILLTREVLETPVTIQPGETGIVTYKIKIS